MNLLILGAWALDIIVGDPPYLAHPVRIMGGAIELAERIARKSTRSDPQREFIAGAIVAVIVIGTSALFAWTMVRSARTLGHAPRRALWVVMGASAIATRDLFDEARSVRAALARGDLAIARARLARIVGRDTADLDSSEIARALIETLAESACDGVVAPLVALALGGVPAAFAFKAASTLDSMIGHREPPYTHFGTVAARIDDAANFVPARLCALLIACAAPIAGGSMRRALGVVRVDARSHASPNAGFPEAAMAGALGVRLGGANSYAGRLREARAINAEGRVPDIASIEAALRVTALACTLAALVASALARG